MGRRSMHLVAAAALAALLALTVPALARADRYVALGDSFSSGVGTNSYTLSSSCLRGVYAYPYLVSQQRPGTSLAFVACSGATTSDVLASQVAAVTPDTGAVSITVGGNDIGFADLIVYCTLAECSSALDSTRTSLAAVLAPRLDAVYAAIRTRAPSASVAVLGYPRLFSGSSCLGTLGISSTERSKANQLADALDGLIASRAAAAGVSYVSALTPFTGHAVCSWTPWVNGLNLFNTTESYHPNRSGNSAGYLPLVRSVIG